MDRLPATASKVSAACEAAAHVHGRPAICGATAAGRPTKPWPTYPPRNPDGSHLEAIISAPRAPVGRRVESPAKRAIQETVARHEGPAIEGGIPIPAGPIPTRSAYHEHLRRRHIRFCRVPRPQPAPTVQAVQASAVSRSNFSGLVCDSSNSLPLPTSVLRSFCCTCNLAVEY